MSCYCALYNIGGALHFFNTYLVSKIWLTSKSDVFEARDLRRSSGISRRGLTQINSYYDRASVPRRNHSSRIDLVRRDSFNDLEVTDRYFVTPESSCLHDGHDLLDKLSPNRYRERAPEAISSMY